MTNPVVVANTTGAVTTGNCTLTSWTPSAGESLWLFLAARSTSITPTISGNGQTWSSLTNVTNAQTQFRLWAWYVASVSSPTTGSIVATLTGNTTPVVAACVRVSGQHASTPLDASATHAGPPVTDDDDMKHSITTTVTDALVLAWGSYRGGLMNSLGAGEVSIVDDLTDGGGGGNATTASLWRENAGAPGSYELGADNDLNSARDWGMILVSIAPAATGGVLIPKLVFRHPARPRGAQPRHRTIPFALAPALRRAA